MTKPGENKVTVRVKVVVEGPGAPAVTDYEERGYPGKRNILSPTPGGNTTVTVTGGQKYISAHGGCPVIAMQYPYKVWALAYPMPNVSPADHPTPDAGAVSTSGTSGTWSFSAVPGAKCDTISGNPDNSTLLVWYDFGTPSAPQYKMPDNTNFHGYCPGSGSGTSAQAARTVRVGCQLLSATLHATFTGTLSGLGSVKLTWNGASWVGESSAGGGCVLSLLWHDPVFQLLSAGPGTAFVVAGPPGSFHPFHWSAAGTALGALAGPFHVNITE